MYLFQLLIVMSPMLLLAALSALWITPSLARRMLVVAVMPATIYFVGAWLVANGIYHGIHPEHRSGVMLPVRNVAEIGGIALAFGIVSAAASHLLNRKKSGK